MAKTNLSVYLFLSVLLNLIFLIMPGRRIEPATPSEVALQLKASIRANVECEARYAKAIASNLRTDPSKPQLLKRLPGEKPADYLKRTGQ